MEFAERAARNEELFRDVNMRIEQGVKMHDVLGEALYHCECDNASCFEMVSLAGADYERVAAERYQFVIAPGHEDPAIERVLERHESYSVVEKIGEARKQLERDHPQQQHKAP